MPEFFQRPRRMIILFLSDTLSAAALVANPARNECAPNSLTGQTFIAACEVRDRVRCHSASADSHGAFIAPNCGKIHRRTAEASAHDRTRHPRLKSGVWPFSTFKLLLSLGQLRMRAPSGTQPQPRSSLAARLLRDMPPATGARLTPRCAGPHSGSRDRRHPGSRHGAG